MREIERNFRNYVQLGDLHRQKKSDFVQKAGHFHDLAGRGTSGKKRDGWQVCIYKAVRSGKSALERSTGHVNMAVILCIIPLVLTLYSMTPTMISGAGIRAQTHFFPYGTDVGDTTLDRHLPWVHPRFRHKFPYQGYDFHKYTVSILILRRLCVETIIYIKKSGFILW